jgi:predicted PurR-regulated permease PerM
MLKELHFMMASFLGAVTLYVIMHKWMIKLCNHYKIKKWINALFLILLSLIVLILPTVWVSSIAFHKIKPFLQDPEILKNTFEQMNVYLQNKLNIDILNKVNIDKITNQGIPFLQSTIGSTINTVLNLVVMYIILFFLLVNNTEVEYWVHKHIPLKKFNTDLAITEFKRLVISNAVGIPLVAIIQGIAGLIGYLIFGVKGAVLLSILTAICSVIPMVGPTLVWGPVSLFMLSQGKESQALWVALWGFLLIGSIDNIARFLLQKKIGNIHPLITIFGVIIGINLFGFVGLIFGPLMVSMFILIIKIYSDEFGIAESDRITEEKLSIE